MKHHAFGRMLFTVTNVGFGAWQIGGSWGDISEADGRAALNAALDAGMTFIDTADVYGDGRSEKIIADVLKGAWRRAPNGRHQGGPPPQSACRRRLQQGQSRRLHRPQPEKPCRR
ncbi:diketogulonate reductase-like aldo/keto reductase [Rhizobium lentis]|nr:diketogulonate reductase-like aldo/keto reductase [Rhizobium lentis]MBB5566727.1 diketogulonate reductase-like aldo/keto reductase [Rhizobium lentis]